MCELKVLVRFHCSKWNGDRTTFGEVSFCDKLQFHTGTRVLPGHPRFRKIRKTYSYMLCYLMLVIKQTKRRLLLFPTFRDLQTYSLLLHRAITVHTWEDSISGVGSPKDSSTFPLRFRSTSGPASGGPRLRVPAHVETTSGHWGLLSCG